ncbi:MAG: hypothetical protein L6R38_003353 [Xanthoria sp. 2 TBL-2021]|nr:MAG: hypothetical protein L6R38_003353 [Xanthoria sp. 2 TBL-2021]
MISTQVNGKDVVCKLRTIPIGFNKRSGPSRLQVRMVPAPGELDDFSDLSFRICQPQHNLSAADLECVQSPQIDYVQIKRWYQCCLTDECGPSPSPPSEELMLEDFRLIDVQRWCIVKCEPPCRYIALSYVWGGSETLRNMQRIRQSLEVEGALLERTHQLPRTIKDAMSLIRKLGESCLWVDSLCIVQDDKNHKRIQIAAMNKIYSSAALTIAVASGDNANSGLPGMSAGDRTFRQHVEQVQSVYLTNCTPSFERAVNDSVWNSRAWTLQERIMSPRILFVAKDRCFFACRHRQHVLIESTTDDPENGIFNENVVNVFKDSSANMIPSSQTVNIVSYRRVVESYTSRHLTFESDILNAFRGIETLFRPLFRSDFVFGLPRSELDSQLLWQPAGPCTRRRDPVTDIPMFPSWSWAGWVGKITCNVEENLSRIEWIEGEDEERFSGKDFRYPKGANGDVHKRLSYRMQWRGGIENHEPYYKENSDKDKYFFHPTAPEEERILGPNLRAGTNHLVFEAETEPENVNAFEIGLDHFWTMAIYKQRCTEEKHIVCPLPLRDTDKYIAGYVMVPGEITAQLSNDADYQIVMISRTKTFEQETRGEGNPDLLDDSEDVTLEKSYFPDRPAVKISKVGDCDPRRFDLTKPWCLYNIMLVEWKHGVAYRLGVGKVHIDAWAQARPQKKIIVLG